MPTSERLTWDMVGHESEVMAKQQEDKEKVQSWFKANGGEQAVRSTGEAFIVFKYIKDRERIQEYFESRPDTTFKLDASTPLELYGVEGEPTSQLWHHMGVDRPTITKKLFSAVLRVLMYIFMVQIMVMLPYAYFFMWPFSRIGSSASGMSQTVMGVVVGIINGQVGGQIYGLSMNVGFHRKESQDTLVLMLSVLMYFFNSMLNMYISVYTVVSTTPVTLESLLEKPTMEAVGLEYELGKTMYSLFVPGMFFVGFIMAILMAGVVPYLQNTILMKLVYVWRSLPLPLLKIVKAIIPFSPEGIEEYPPWNAEKALEPMEIQIGDYANFIMFPLLSCISLFFMSPFTPQLMKMLLGWGVFYYCYLRYMHLRFCKKCYYTRATIDVYANFLWGLPLSLIAVAATVWGMRSEVFGTEWSIGLKLFALVLAFCFSLAAWMLAYWYGVQPKGRLEVSEEGSNAGLDVFEQQANLVYSWFNCNPVFVLKSKHMYQEQNAEPKGPQVQLLTPCYGPSQEEEGTKAFNHPLACGMDPNSVRYYVVGKEYLFLKPERQHLALMPSNGMEFETYLEALLHYMGVVRGLCSRKANGPDAYASGKVAPKEESKGLLET